MVRVAGDVVYFFLYFSRSVLTSATESTPAFGAVAASELSVGAALYDAGKSVEYFHHYDHCVDWVFVHCEEFFAGREGFYGDSKGPHKDNLWRFRLLSLAALEATVHLPLGGAVYGEKCVFVANDWQTALVGWPHPRHLRCIQRLPRAHHHASPHLCHHAMP